MRTEMDDLLIRGLSSFKVKNGAGAEIYLRLKNKPELQEQLMNFMADNRDATYPGQRRSELDGGAAGLLQGQQGAGC